MQLNPSDHVCAVYTSLDELAEIVGDFLADGLERGERCWYVSVNQSDRVAVRKRLRHHDIDVDAAAKRGALRITSSDTTYALGGQFDPEVTLSLFSAAIEQALTDGFSGFRAAAEMSGVLACPDGAEGLIVYESLLASLFSTARATGLCLYHRDQMPAAVLDGALATHPVVHVPGRSYELNPYYDGLVESLPTSDETTVRQKLHDLEHRRRR